MNLYHLIQINLRWCRECEEVPTLGQLPCLRVLEIYYMGKVRCIGSEFYFYSDGSYRNSTTLFPALRILKLGWMCSLEEWKDAKELTTADEVFPCLEELTIRGCPNLRDLPDSLCTCVSLQKLVVYNCYELRSLPGVPSVIRHLEIIECGIDELPSGLQFCASLQYLVIRRCSNLKSIPDLEKVFHSLINLKLSNNSPYPRLILSRREGRLKTLVIGEFIEDLNAFSILRYPSFQYSYASLKKLLLHGSPTLNSLPNKIQLFTALEEPWINKFNRMKALPNWLGNLSSLQKLSLRYCNNLMYLPMFHLTKSKHLHIADCSNLEKRFAEGSGEEWFQISHIPNIKINGKYIQGKDSEDSKYFDIFDDSD